MIVCKAINRIETAVTCPELQNLPKYSTALAWHTLMKNIVRVILITAPENNAPWRSFGMCQLTFTSDWTGQLAFLIQTHLFKRLVAERFYSPELSPPHHVHN